MQNKAIALALFLFSLSVKAEQIVEIIRLFNRPAAEIQPVLAPLLNDSDSLVANGFNLIVKTSPERLEEVKALVKQLDAKLQNLAITVIQSKNKTADQLNAELGVAVNVPLDHASKTRARIEGRYQQQQSQQNSQHKQVIKTLEGNRAYIKVGASQPVRYINQYNSASGHRMVSAHTDLYEATTGFAVLPRLNGNQVILEISPWSDEFKQNGMMETQSAQTTLTTQLSRWIEIASVDQQQQSSNRSFLSTHKGNKSKKIHILVKVDKIN